VRSRLRGEVPFPRPWVKNHLPRLMVPTSPSSDRCKVQAFAQTVSKRIPANDLGYVQDSTAPTESGHIALAVPFPEVRWGKYPS
jgi:hypothetical protein